MAAPYNRYGMPNGAYAQGAQAARSGNNENLPDPQDSLLAAGLPPTPTAVSRTGQPNQDATTPRIMPYIDPNTPLDNTGRTLGNGGISAGIHPPPGYMPTETSDYRQIATQAPANDQARRASEAAGYGYGGRRPGEPYSPSLSPIPTGTPPPAASTTERQALQNVLNPPSLTGRYNNGDFDYNDAATVVGNAYTQYLHRPGSPQEIQTHLRNQGANAGPVGRVGQSGLNYVISQIANSPESRNYTAPTTPSATASSPNDVTALVNDWMQHSNPYGHKDAQYWIDKINQHGGMDPGNVAYFKKRFLEDPNNNPQSPQNQPGGLPSNITAIQRALEGGQTMTPDFTQQLLQQLMQSLATQRALF